LQKARKQNRDKSTPSQPPLGSTSPTDEQTLGANIYAQPQNTPLRQKPPPIFQTMREKVS
jgi:hypothetical protein